MTNAQMIETINNRINELKATKEIQEILKTMTEDEGKKFLMDTAISTLLGI